MIPRGSPPPPPPQQRRQQQQQQQQRRKKWTEEEERALIDKYAAMAADGSLARLRTRERRFRPIAEHVNARHHGADPDAFPFAWSWKDASTKVQNMRHQFLLVKQKLLSASPLLPPHQSDSSPHHHPALSLWPNFLHYRDVFGDAPLPLKPPSDPSAAAPLAETQNLEEELGDEAEAEAEAERPARSRGKKRRRRRRREAAEERRRRRWEKEEEEEREREREWEERMERRRAEWRKRADDAARQHRAEMEHIHARIVHDHHAFLNHLLGFFSNWVGGGGGGGGGVSDGVGGAAPSPGNHHNHNSSHHRNQYMSQMMQGLHQVNGTVPEEENPTTTTEDGHEDQFIVD